MAKRASSRSPKPPTTFRVWYRRQSAEERKAFTEGIGLVVGVVGLTVLTRATYPGPVALPAAFMLHVLSAAVTLSLLMQWKRPGAILHHVRLVVSGQARASRAYVDTFHVVAAALALVSTLVIVRGLLAPLWIAGAVGFVAVVMLVPPLLVFLFDR